MVNFLTITCIKPIKRKFLGILPLNTAAIFAALCIAAIAFYTYEEAQIYFGMHRILIFFTHDYPFYAQIAVAILTLLCYILNSKCYTKMIYSATFGLTGFSLCLNLWKKSLLFEEVYYEDDDEIVRWLYLIRIGAEFAIELYSCYLVFSISQSIRD